MPAAHLVWPICDFTEPSTHAPGAAPARVKTSVERRELGAIADDGAGAVRLDEPDLGRRHAGRAYARSSARTWPSLRGAVRPRLLPSLAPATPLITA